MIAFVGGTGPEGQGLALRLAIAGQEVVIGSRSLERAQEAAEKIRQRRPTARVDGAENAEAVRQADIIIVTVPYAAQRSTLSDLAPAIGEKLVIDTVVPLAFEGGSARYLSVEDGSAAQEAQRLLPHARVAAAFHNLSAKKLLAGDTIMDGDVVVCANDPDAKKTTMGLVELIPALRPVDGGGLVNASQVEQITALLANLNRIHKRQTSIRIVGL
jgi:hypothetical protein